jgi:hypothetical protein
MGGRPGVGRDCLVALGYRHGLAQLSLTSPTIISTITARACDQPPAWAYGGHYRKRCSDCYHSLFLLSASHYGSFYKLDGHWMGILGLLVWEGKSLEGGRVGLDILLAHTLWNGLEKYQPGPTLTLLYTTFILFSRNNSPVVEAVHVLPS